MQSAPSFGTRLRRTATVLLACGCLGAMGLYAQTPKPEPAQDKQPQKPATDQQTKPPAESNPFPGDTTNVPVMPNADTPPSAPENANVPVAPATLPSEDADPARSPDDATAGPVSSDGTSSSSSGVDLNRLLEPPADDAKNHGAKNQPPPQHTETAEEDEKVGAYYLSEKNWKAALSRYQSALVLDPENPDVYWGLAESERHLGQFIEAKANYQKVMEYDPDSKHAKEAKKLLNDPQLANANPPAHP